MAKVKIRNGSKADPEVCSIKPFEKITFEPETPETIVDITFEFASPIIEWRSKKEPKGKPVKGRVNPCVQIGDRFPYTVGPTSDRGTLRAGPELIVDGGLLKKLARQATRRVSRRRTGRKRAAKKR